MGNLIELNKKIVKHNINLNNVPVLGNEGLTITVNSNESPQLYLNDQHVASGWGFDSKETVNRVLTLISNSYNGNIGDALNQLQQYIKSIETSSGNQSSTLLSSGNATDNAVTPSSIKLANANNNASSEGSIALGNTLTISGKYSIGEGTGNEISGSAINAHVGGEHSKVYANNSISFGSSNTINDNADNSAIFGSSNSINANVKHSFISGIGNIVTSSYEASFGKYNNSSEGITLFSVGNGNTASRYNVFEITKDNRIILNGQTYFIELNNGNTSISEYMANSYTKTYDIVTSLNTTINALNTNIDEVVEEKVRPSYELCYNSISSWLDESYSYLTSFNDSSYNMVYTSLNSYMIDAYSYLTSFNDSSYNMVYTSLNSYMISAYSYLTSFNDSSYNMVYTSLNSYMIDAYSYLTSFNDSSYNSIYDVVVDNVQYLGDAYTYINNYNVNAYNMLYNSLNNYATGKYSYLTNFNNTAYTTLFNNLNTYIFNTYTYFTNFINTNWATITGGSGVNLTQVQGEIHSYGADLKELCYIYTRNYVNESGPNSTLVNDAKEEIKTYMGTYVNTTYINLYTNLNSYMVSSYSYLMDFNNVSYTNLSSYVLGAYSYITDFNNTAYTSLDNYITTTYSYFTNFIDSNWTSRSSQPEEGLTQSSYDTCYNSIADYLSSYITPFNNTAYNMLYQSIKALESRIHELENPE